MEHDGIKANNSVTLDPGKCNGCINCMKRCPTEAIRVRNGKAKVDHDACIDCGECVRVCRSKAKIPVYDPLAAVESSGFKYKIALPGPSLFAQFNNLDGIDTVLAGLKMIGFDGVYETALGCEIATRLTMSLFEGGKAQKPLISSACPAVIRLITHKYESLIDNISPVMAPEEIAARIAREEAAKTTGLAQDEIGVFFISPCSANVCSLKTGASQNYINYVLSQSEIYFKLLSVLPKVGKTGDEGKAGRLGLSWCLIGGEAKGVRRDRFLAADGIENVISVLDALDDGQLGGLDFVELAACPGGCVGGVLNVENPFVARSKIQLLKKKMPERLRNTIYYDMDISRFLSLEPYTAKGVYKLSDDRAEAMKALVEITRIHNSLPGFDCGMCGAPSCRAFAEDVARGQADIKCQRTGAGK